jgi:hypothetical protein
MKIKRLLILASMALVGFSACTKDSDDDDSTTPQQFPQELLIDGTRYELGEGFVLSYGEAPFHQGTNLDLNVVTSGISVSFDASGFPDTATGSGYIFYLEMYSPDSTFISPGTYTIDTAGSGNLFTISSGATFTYGVANELEYGFINGSVEVTRLNGVSTFVGTFTEQGGKEVKFSYQKTLAVIDDN